MLYSYLMLQKKKEDSDSFDDFNEGGKFTVEDDTSTASMDTVPNTNCACIKALYRTITRKTTQESAASAYTQ